MLCNGSSSMRAPRGPGNGALHLADLRKTTNNSDWVDCACLPCLSSMVQRRGFEQAPLKYCMQGHEHGLTSFHALVWHAPRAQALLFKRPGHRRTWLKRSVLGNFRRRLGDSQHADARRLESYKLLTAL